MVTNSEEAAAATAEHAEKENGERNARITLAINHPPVNGLLAFSDSMITHFARKKRPGDKFIDNALDYARIAKKNAQEEIDNLPDDWTTPQLDHLVDYIENQVGISFPRDETARAKEAFIALDDLNRLNKLPLGDKRHIVKNPDEFLLEKDYQQLSVLSLVASDPEYKASLSQKTIGKLTKRIQAMKSSIPDIGNESKVQQALGFYEEILAK